MVICWIDGQASNRWRRRQAGEVEGRSGAYVGFIRQTDTAANQLSPTAVSSGSRQFLGDLARQAATTAAFARLLAANPPQLTIIQSAVYCVHLSQG